MDTAQIRFHAVYRTGKRKENKHRPITAHFVCREDPSPGFLPGRRELKRAQGSRMLA